MYAIVSIGARQYRVAEGEEFKVERLDLKPTKRLTLKEVLLVGNDGEVEIGRPYLSKARVVCEVIGEEKAEKITIFKYKRRKNYRKKQGHRQVLTVLRVKEIRFGSSGKEK